jgi:uncharacterized protein YbjT (DUF2867 family)
MRDPIQVLDVAIFGASGMVGAAVLDHCLRDPDVRSVVAVGRTTCGVSHPKLREVLASDLFELSAQAESLKGLNACFFTIGSSVVGKTEAEYARTNLELPVSTAKFLLELNPDLGFTYVSGGGTDETEKGKVLWARVKGKTENVLISLPLRNATMFRLAGLVPLRSHPSKTKLYRVFYRPVAPILPLLARLFPGYVTTPDILGRAMVRAAQGHSHLRRLEAQDIDALGRG